MLERGWLAGGNTARNTAIIRSNYLTPDGVRFYDELVRLFQDLSTDLDLNIIYSERGHLTLAHTDAAIRTARWRAEVNKHLGVDSEPGLARRDPAALPGAQPVGRGALPDPRRPLPSARARSRATTRSPGAMPAAPPGAASRSTPRPRSPGSGSRTAGRSASRPTAASSRPAGSLQAVAGNSSEVARLAGLRLPIRTIPLQACVSEPYKPILDPIIVSGSLHVYISQSARGEFVMGGSTDPYALYHTRSTLDFKEGLMAHMLELFPFLAEAKVLRQWAGMADMTPDFSPVMGLTPVRELLHRCRLGHLGLQGDAGLRQAHGGMPRHRQAAGPDRALRARPLRPLRSGRREGRGLGGALNTMKLIHCPLNGPRNISGVRPGPRGQGHAGPGRRQRRRMGRLRLPRGEPQGRGREWWCHAPTNYWFIGERDTVTDRCCARFDAGELFPERKAFR